jgi:hypothetical protein
LKLEIPWGKPHRGNRAAGELTGFCGGGACKALLPLFFFLAKPFLFIYFLPGSCRATENQLINQYFKEHFLQADH